MPLGCTVSELPKMGFDWDAPKTIFRLDSSIELLCTPVPLAEPSVAVSAPVMSYQST